MLIAGLPAGAHGSGVTQHSQRLRGRGPGRGPAHLRSPRPHPGEKGHRDPAAQLSRGEHGAPHAPGVVHSPWPQSITCRHTAGHAQPRGAWHAPHAPLPCHTCYKHPSTYQETARVYSGCCPPPNVSHWHWHSRDRHDPYSLAMMCSKQTCAQAGVRRDRCSHVHPCPLCTPAVPCSQCHTCSHVCIRRTQLSHVCNTCVQAPVWTHHPLLDAGGCSARPRCAHPGGTGGQRSASSRPRDPEWGGGCWDPICR